MRRSNGCALCGTAKASGWGWINDEQFCHDPESFIPSCYEEASWAMEAGFLGDWLDEDPLESMKKRKEEYK